MKCKEEARLGQGKCGGKGKDKDKGGGGSSSNSKAGKGQGKAKAKAKEGWEPARLGRLGPSGASWRRKA